MRVLFDTHTAAWALGDASLLGKGVQQLLLDTNVQIFYSAVNVLEMSLKHHNGKWEEVGVIVKGDFVQLFAEIGATELPVYASHANLAGAFSSAHKDPFDRLLAAQAICENLVLLSKDTQMDTFSVQRLWD
jgi:PIN domain nuclease of toxin-antitoxin system